MTNTADLLAALTPLLIVVTTVITARHLAHRRLVYAAQSLAAGSIFTYVGVTFGTQPADDTLARLIGLAVVVMAAAAVFGACAPRVFGTRGS